MDSARTAELQVLLEGVPLPAGRQSLLEYAEHEGAGADLLAALRSLAPRRYDNLDDVAEQLHPVQPRGGRAEPPRPGPESGAPPGGEAYLEPVSE